MESKIIAITNQKGGVGKTTTAVNPGTGLARQGKRVLLIDADPQGSLTVSLGIKNPDELQVSLASVMQHVIDDRLQAEDFEFIGHPEGIDLLPSNIELSAFEIGLFNTMSREYVLEHYLENIRHIYDYILIDCMPSLGMMTINALAAAEILAAAACEFYNNEELVAKAKEELAERLADEPYFEALPKDAKPEIW